MNVYTCEEYLKNIEERIANLRESLSEYEKIYKLFSEHPELYREFMRIASVK